MEIIYKYGYKFYIIHKDSVLYRGDKSQTVGGLGLRDIEYFTFERLIARQYGHGYISSYSCNSDLLLYAMDDIKNIENLYSICDDITKNHITKSFGYPNDLIRNSTGYSDYKIIEFMCTLSLDGYACEEIINPTFKFHSEVAICNPLKFLNKIY